MANRGDPFHRIPSHWEHLEEICKLSKAAQPSPRELQILVAYALGYTPPRQAPIFNITENTVRTHLQNLIEKLHAENITHALWLVRHCGWFQERESEIEAEVMFLITDWESLPSTS